ncbi:alpha/beta hydrolase like protein [Pseudomonas phage RSP]|nr:alpha/beta hydrolase like protein [Pseudomonas phage RSP]
MCCNQPVPQCCGPFTTPSAPFLIQPVSAPVVPRAAPFFTQSRGRCCKKFDCCSILAMARR